MSRRAAGTPCWAELGGPAEPQLLDHYATLLGWEFGENRTVSGYQRGFAGGEKVAGFGGPRSPQPTDGWRGYLSVDDLESVLSDARLLGANIVSDTVLVGADGRFSWILDPGGAYVGLFEPNDDPGTSRVPGPGRIVDWVLVSPRADSSIEFHATLFPAVHQHLRAAERDGIGGWRPMFAADPSTAGVHIDPAGNIAHLVAWE